MAIEHGGILLRTLQRIYRLRHHYGRELTRLERLPRYTPTVTNLLGEPIHIVDAYSFLLMKREIFNEHAYDFKPSGPRPLILDCGANVGLATLYWKRKLPEARIVAFEPDPDLFQALRLNTKNLRDVMLLPKAVWRENCELPFRAEGSYAGRVCVAGDERSFVVSAVRLREFLDEPIDLLKIDIEGAECEVVADCSESLSNVRNLFVEYHSFPNMPQVLPELLLVLKKAGFRYHVKGVRMARPLVSRLLSEDMDLRLDIFAYRN